MKVLSFYAAVDFQWDGEVNSGESNVIPSQSLTVQDILRRFRRGTLDLSQISQSGYYDDEEGITDDIDNISDPVEAMEYVQKIKDRRSKIYEQIRQSSASGGNGNRSDDSSDNISQESEKE